MPGAECKAKTNCALGAQFQTAPTMVMENHDYPFKFLIFMWSNMSIAKCAYCQHQDLQDYRIYRIFLLSESRILADYTDFADFKRLYV